MRSRSSSSAARPGTFEEHHAEQAALTGRKPPPWLIEKRNAQVAHKRERRARKRTPYDPGLNR